MVNILDSNYNVIFTIDEGAIYQGNTRLFEIQNGNKYVDAINGGFYEYESDTGVIKSWGITVTYNFQGTNITKSLPYVFLYNFVENGTIINDASGNSIAIKGQDEQGDTGVIKSWGITVQYNNVIKIENSVDEKSEVLLTLLALGVILIPSVSNPS